MSPSEAMKKKYVLYWKKGDGDGIMLSSNLLLHLEWMCMTNEHWRSSSDCLCML